MQDDLATVLQWRRRQRGTTMNNVTHTVTFDSRHVQNIVRFNTFKLVRF